MIEGLEQALGNQLSTSVHIVGCEPIYDEA